MSELKKYELISCYKLIGSKYKTNMYFYKYTGVYLVVLKTYLTSGLYYNHHVFFTNKDVCYQSINSIKNYFYVKKIKFSQKKKYDVTLSPEGECFFDCPMCEHNLYLRGLFWDINDENKQKCESDGIYLTTDDTYDFHWRPEQYKIGKCDLFDHNNIKTSQEFVELIGYTSCNSGSGYYCDCDSHVNDSSDSKRGFTSSYSYYDIYFCKKCNDDHNNSELDGSINDYNLCKMCYTPENIEKHLKTHEDGSEFFMKETIKFAFIK